MTPGSLERDTAIPSFHETHRARVTAPGPPLTRCYSERPSCPSGFPPPNSVFFPPHHVTSSFVFCTSLLTSLVLSFLGWKMREENTRLRLPKRISKNASLRDTCGVKCCVVVLSLRKTKCLSPLLEMCNGSQQGKGFKRFCNKEKRLMLLRPAFPERVWLTGVFPV